jgi:hypothetical protein
MSSHDPVVLVLGAGFSRTAGHPVMAEFRKVVTELATNPGSPLAEQERLWFKSVLDYRWRAQALYGYLNFDLDNLENLFGLLDMECSLGDKDDPFLRASRWALIFTLVKTLETTRKPMLGRLQDEVTACKRAATFGELRERTKYPAHPLAPYVSFLQNLRPHDAIITFNYDTVIEEALLALSIGSDYGFSSFASPGVQYAIPVLKLHGSVNFRQREDGAVEVVDYEFLEESTKEYYSGGAPLIVPPTWNKGALTSAIQTIWQRAATRLRAAARIVFIGYSLPETDVGFRYLLANSLLANQLFPAVAVMDPDPIARERYDRLFADVLKQQGRYIAFDATFPKVPSGLLRPTS